MVLRYSTRLSRRMVTRPGSGFKGSMPNTSLLIQVSRVFCCSCEGRGLFSGGINPARTFFNAASQRSRLASNSSCDLNESNATFPLLIPSPWQSKQNSVRMGRTSLRNRAADGVSAVVARAASVASATRASRRERHDQDEPRPAASWPLHRVCAWLNMGGITTTLLTANIPVDYCFAVQRATLNRASLWTPPGTAIGCNRAGAWRLRRCNVRESTSQPFVHVIRMVKRRKRRPPGQCPAALHHFAQLGGGFGAGPGGRLPGGPFVPRLSREPSPRSWPRPAFPRHASHPRDIS